MFLHWNSGEISRSQISDYQLSKSMNLPRYTLLCTEKNAELFLRDCHVFHLIVNLRLHVNLSNSWRTWGEIWSNCQTFPRRLFFFLLPLSLSYLNFQFDLMKRESVAFSEDSSESQIQLVTLAMSSSLIFYFKESEHPPVRDFIDKVSICCTRLLLLEKSFSYFHTKWWLYLHHRIDFISSTSETFFFS